MILALLTGATGGGLAPTDYLVIAAYLAITLSVGILLTRKASRSIDSFFLGNRQIPWWALSASGMASNVDISGTMVAVALVYALGVNGFFVEIRGGVVLVMAILLAFMGKWNRRSRVMTKAEWMRFRFGTGPGGNFARLASAIAELVVTVWVVAYFAKGAAGFVGPLIAPDLQWLLENTFLGSLHWLFGAGSIEAVDPTTVATVILVFFTLTYSTASGLYGVVWTDVFQGTLILIAILYMSFKAFSLPALPESFEVSLPLGEDGFVAAAMDRETWVSGIPAWSKDLVGTYGREFNAFGPLILVFLLRQLIEGYSGSGGYMIQRYLACKSDREAGLVALLWTFFLSLRWPLIAAFAFLGIHIGLQGGTPIENPEDVLPVVLDRMVPVGLKGLLVACFIAAFMSTFSSWINSSAAYWVKDIYHAYLHPTAGERTLVWQGRLASLTIVIGGVVMALYLPTINKIWDFLTASISGLAIPMLLRWYWWRFSGGAFAIGTILGVTMSIVMASPLGEIVAGWFAFVPGGIRSFLVVGVPALAGCLIAARFFSPTDHATLARFYATTRPFGFWKPLRERYSRETLHAIDAENRRDVIASFVAVPWQLVLFLTPMMLVLRQWSWFTGFLVVLALLSLLLWAVWFRHLSTEVRMDTPATPDATRP